MHSAKKKVNSASATRGGKPASKADTPVPEEKVQAAVDVEVHADHQKHAIIQEVVLTEEQLNEEFNRVLNASDPNIAKKLARFNYKEGVFKDEQYIDQTAVHLSIEGSIALIGSDDARPVDEAKLAQLELTQPNNGVNVAAAATSTDNNNNNAANPEENSNAENQSEEQKDETAVVETSVKNQFNYSERMCQTYTNPMRDHDSMTEPPATSTFSGNATQFEIFDSYLEAFLLARAAKDGISKKKGDDDKNKDSGISQYMSSTKMLNKLYQDPKFVEKLRTLERLTSQNADEALFHAYKYFDDPADADKQGGRGSLLPLWTFSLDAAKKKSVTSICWNPKYSDLFAVGYGSFDFLKNSTGVIGCFSLKNPSYPEYLFLTQSGVLCLDFHPQHPALLAVGLYDGTVAVYDVRSKNKTPIYQSTDPKARHTDPVWQVKWQLDEGGKSISFHSISSDGRVTCWMMNKNELVNQEVMELKLVPIRDNSFSEKINLSSTTSSAPTPTPDSTPSKSSSSSSSGDDDVSLVGLAAGSCFSFNPRSSHLFVVGTEEGALHKCSTSYSSQYLQTYEGHSMAVYSVMWNHFHPRVFLSCSADWSVKVWDAQNSRPVMSFDIGTPVGDAAWAPFSSTVFAVCSADGKVFVFDLSVDKYEPIAEHRVYTPKSNRHFKAIQSAVQAASTSSVPVPPAADPIIKCTKIAFNQSTPVLLVGDDRGVVTSVKLSPNLRKTTLKGWEHIDAKVEEDRLEKLLIHFSKNDAEL